MKYLHKVSEGIFFLDHRLTPEVRAMLAAMASRAPLGGIRARYTQLVTAVAGGLLDEEDAQCTPERLQRAKEYIEAVGGSFTREIRVAIRWDLAEDRLCEYPLHDKVQEFFDQFVGRYGHSSILELSGSPTVYTEGISWFTAWLLFDSPLCSGQEFSTRAVRHKDWPIAREAQDYKRVEITRVVDGHTLEFGEIGETAVSEQFPTEDVNPGDILEISLGPNPTLQALHQGWLELFAVEVEAWRKEFQSPCLTCGGTGKIEGLICSDCEGTGKFYPDKDKEPFRPALDHSRWAVPGTIATGCCHTGHLRERARVISNGLAITQDALAAHRTWQAIQTGYRAAIPGLAGLGLREAVYADNERVLSSHLIPKIREAGKYVPVKVELGSCPRHILRVAFSRPAGSKTYVDPVLNEVRVRLAFQCSLAVARDWHRHRTAYPWRLTILHHAKADIARSVKEKTGLFFDEGIRIHPAYSTWNQDEQMGALLRQSYEACHAFLDEGGVTRAMMALPLGTLVEMACEMGLRDAIYMLELRRDTVGSCFEYRDQAAEAMKQLENLLPAPHRKLCGL